VTYRRRLLVGRRRAVANAFGLVVSRSRPARSPENDH
jgi:hypothetical protein